MKLPYAVRECLIIAIDEYLEDDNDQPDARDLAEAVVRCLVSSAEECDIEDSDEIIEQIEEANEMEESLTDTLEESFAKNGDLELTGEDIVMHSEKALELSWTDEDMLDDMDELDELPLSETEEEEL